MWWVINIYPHRDAIARKHPEKFDPPYLPAYLGVFVDAFLSLSGQRDHNGAFPQPIKISEILSYCDMKGFYSCIVKEKMLQYVIALDRDHLNEKIGRLNQQLSK